MKNLAFLKPSLLFTPYVLLLFLLNTSLAYPDEAVDPSVECTVSDPHEIKLIPNSNIIYFRPGNLCLNSTKEIGETFRSFFKTNPGEFSGLVLDLRNTQEGFHSSVAGIASIFILPDQYVTSFKDDIGRSVQIKTGRDFYQKEKSEIDYLSGLPQSLKIMPIAVLVGANTKKAGDAIASGLLHNKRAVLVGEEFENGLSDNSVIVNHFYQEVIKNYPIPNINLTKNLTDLKEYVKLTRIPEGCTSHETDEWKNSTRNLVLQNVKYPRESVRREEEGVGIILMELNVNGKIHHVNLESSTGSISLDQAMYSAVSSTKTLPLTCSTKEKIISIGVTFEFRLK